MFLETQLDELIDQLGDDHTVEVLAKTAKKMSPAGLAAAGGLELSADGHRLLRRRRSRAAAVASDPRPRTKVRR